MHPPISREQWAALRELREGAAPVYPLLAKAADIHVTTLREAAAREKWDKLYLRSSRAKALRLRLNEIERMRSGEAIDEDDFAAELVSDDFVGGRTGGSTGDVAGGPEDGAAEAASDPAEDDPVELLARTTSFVSRQLGQLISVAERRGGRLDRSRIDSLVALSKMMERWEALAKERAKKEEQKSDDELADILRKIDDRIIELAEAEAGRLVEQFLADQPDDGAGWRVILESEAQPVSVVAPPRRGA